LRAFVLLLAVSTFFAAGGERARRVAAAFDWQGVVVPPNFRLGRLGVATALHRQAAGDPARPAGRVSRRRHGLGGRYRSAAN